MPEGVIVWVVGKIEKKFNKVGMWEFIKVFDFDKKEDAIAICKTKNHFIAPMDSEELFPNNAVDEWKGSFYPLKM